MVDGGRGRARTRGTSFVTLSLEQPAARHAPAIRLGHRSSFLLVVTTIFGIAAFGWPLLIHQTSTQNAAHSSDAPWIFVALVPLLIAIVMAELSEGGIDAKAIALARHPRSVLLRLAYRQSGDRWLRAGVVPAHPGRSRLRSRFRLRARGGRSFRVGPCHRWHRPVAPVPDACRRLDRLRCRLSPPCAGLLRTPRSRRLRSPRRHLSTGCSPTSGSGRSSGSETRYSFVPGAGVAFNLHRFLLFDLTTSMGFDLTRAVTCAVLIIVLGRPVLAALRRAARRAVFEPAPQFVD